MTLLNPWFHPQSSNATERADREADERATRAVLYPESSRVCRALPVVPPPVRPRPAAHETHEEDEQ